ASSGAISISVFKEERVFSSERTSRYAPKRNRNVTAADSTYSPINKAPTTAIVTSNSILNDFIITDWIAFLAMDQPATTVATISAVFFQNSKSIILKINAVTNKIPEIITM